MEPGYHDLCGLQETSNREDTAESIQAQIFSSDSSTTPTNTSPFLKQNKVTPMCVDFCSSNLSLTKQKVSKYSFLDFSQAPGLCFSPMVAAGVIAVAVRELVAHRPC